MFRESITHAGGVTEGTASEAHALTALRRAVRRGYAIEATRDGGALVTWSRRELSGGIAHRAVQFTPEMPVGALTESVIQDLRLIDDMRGAQYVENDNGRRIIRIGFLEIAPMVTARLRARKLVTDEDNVRITLTARLGLLATAHRTSTTEPGGWSRPADIGRQDWTAGLNRPGRRAGLINSTASHATCTCGQFTAVGGSRDEARALARTHRQAMATEFVTGLDPLTATA
ncbi:hypothetical protein ACFWAP_03710 [Streptomyces goshikiensis]|uniref:hypothetical protein n=1 Tax=Streptomyces goshikiensis TaxID=1942 RepID=UPI003650E662